MLEDYKVERPDRVSASAWQKQQSRHTWSGLAKVKVCESVDEVVKVAATLLKPWNLEAFLYLHVCDRSPEQPLHLPFSVVEASLHPTEDPPEPPLAIEAEICNQELEHFIFEEFGFEVSRSSSSTKRT